MELVGSFHEPKQSEFSGGIHGFGCRRQSEKHVQRLANLSGLPWFSSVGWSRHSKDQIQTTQSRLDDWRRFVSKWNATTLAKSRREKTKAFWGNVFLGVGQRTCCSVGWKTLRLRSGGANWTNNIRTQNHRKWQGAFGLPIKDTHWCQ